MAYRFYVTIEGSQQGAFSDGSISKATQGKLTGDGYHHEISAPIETVSGGIRGRVQHQPITFRHFWGASSPQLFRAMTTSEMLNRVVFEFSRPSEKTEKMAAEEIFYRVTLTNAHIIGIQYVSATSNESEAEVISLAYERIEVEFVPGKAIASDTWLGGRG